MLQSHSFLIYAQLLAFGSFAQIPINFEVDQLYFPQEELRKQEIRSVHVNWQQSASDIILNTSEVIHERMEAEFNSHGKMTYQCYSPVVPSDLKNPEPLGYVFSTFLFFQYDNQQRLVDRCFEEDFGKVCEHFRYDETGNLISLANDGDLIDPVSYTFQWGEDGILENVSCFGADKRNKKFYNLDTEGKLSRINHPDGTHTLYGYADENDTATTYITHFHRDIRLSDIKQRKYISTGQLFYESKVMANNDTVYEKTIRYDEHHNTSAFFSTNNSKRLEFLKQNENNVIDGLPFEAIPKPEIVVCNILNEYDDNLLTKRTITFLKPNGQIDENYGFIRETIRYEKTPLKDKPWKFE